MRITHEEVEKSPRQGDLASASRRLTLIFGYQIIIYQLR
jgi:hypothetical protein